MRRAPYNRLVTGFALPRNAPPEVEAAWEEFDRVTEQYAAAEARVRNAATTVKTAAEADVQRNRKDLATGKKLTKPNAEEEKARAQVGADKAELAALEIIVDEVGDKLALAINNSREVWLAEAEARVAAATEDHHAALAAMKDALARLAEARGTRKWLRTWRPVTEPENGPGIFVESHEFSNLFFSPRPVTVRTREFARLDNPSPVTPILEVLGRVGEDDSDDDPSPFITVVMR